MRQKVIKTGNSLAVTIPAGFAQVVGIKAGDEVKLELKLDKAQAIYSFSGHKQLPLLENWFKKKK